MRLIFIISLLISVSMTNLAFGAATVFLKDGSREDGNAVWIEGAAVFLSKSTTIYEFAGDEVQMEETQKFNRIGKYSDLTLPGSGSGHVRQAAPNDLVEQLMKGAHIDRQIDLFIQQFRSGALSSAGENGEFGDILAQALDGFDSRKAKQKIRAYYRSHLDAKTLQAIVSWTDGPLGMKVSAAQVGKAVTSADMAREILSDLEEHPPTAQRLALIKELDSAGRTTEMSLQLIVDAVTGATGAFPGASADKKKVRKEIMQQISQREAEMEPQLRKMVQAGLIHTYGELSDGELRELVTFMRSEPARKFTKATMGALSEMTRTMSASIIKQVVKASKQRVTAER